MAEKEKSLNALKMQLGKLKKQEQTPEVMEKIDNLLLKIESYKAETPGEQPKTGKSGSPAFTHEEWRIELKNPRKEMINGKETTVFDFEKTKLLKKVILDPIHEGILNEQTVNTKLLYVKI